jgi:hypothetical protein
VVGSVRNRPVGRIVTDHLLHGALCPVAIHRAATRRRPTACSIGAALVDTAEGRERSAPPPRLPASTRSGRPSRCSSRAAPPAASPSSARTSTCSRAARAAQAPPRPSCCEASRAPARAIRTPAGRPFTRRRGRARGAPASPPAQRRSATAYRERLP